MYSVHHTTHGRPLKLWDSHGDFEPQAMDQLRNIASLPFIHSHVAGMPDVHLGKGATVGSVIATKRAIVPAAVGVDIGCGMMAVKTSLTASDLPDNCDDLRAWIEFKVPKGFETSEKAGHIRGSWAEVPEDVRGLWLNKFQDRWFKILNKHKGVNGITMHQLGTMGGGNHFIEICLDQNDHVWVMLHSGSRGTGNRIGSYFIEKAKELMVTGGAELFLLDQDLAFLVEGTPLFNDYIEAMTFAQDFAMENRNLMMKRVLTVLRTFLPPFTIDDQAINCHHNYATKEHHFGENVWLTRKGAVRARKGDLGIIPGSMGTGSFIVRGLGNEESFCSCSHGAGRKMSRGQAKQAITLEEHAAAMQGISARLDADVLDESPAAYKDIGAVMAAQEDLVEVVYRLRQIINVKG